MAENDMNMKAFISKYKVLYICTYIVLLTGFISLFGEELKNCIILKLDDANKKALTGNVTSTHLRTGRTGSHSCTIYYSFTPDKEIMHGSSSFGGSCPEVKLIRLLYNERINFSYAEELLNQNIITEALFIILMPTIISLMIFGAHIEQKKALANPYGTFYRRKRN